MWAQAGITAGGAAAATVLLCPTIVGCFAVGGLDTIASANVVPTIEVHFLKSEE